MRQVERGINTRLYVRCISGPIVVPANAQSDGATSLIRRNMVCAAFSFEHADFARHERIEV